MKHYSNSGINTDGMIIAFHQVFFVPRDSPVDDGEGDQGGVLQVLLSKPRPDKLARGNLLNREDLDCQKEKMLTHV